MKYKERANHPKAAKNIDPYLLLGEAIVTSGVSDLKQRYKQLKRALIKSWDVSVYAAHARREEAFFFSELYSAITSIDGRKIIKYVREQVGIGYKNGKWFATDIECQPVKYATKKSSNLGVLAKLYKHIKGNLKGFGTLKRNALRFHGVNKDITDDYLLELVDRTAPGWRSEHNLNSAEDIRKELKTIDFERR